MITLDEAARAKILIEDYEFQQRRLKFHCDGYCKGCDKSVPDRYICLMFNGNMQKEIHGRYSDILCAEGPPRNKVIFIWVRG